MPSSTVPAAIAVLQSLQDACTYNGALERAAVARGAAPIPVTPFHSSVVPPVSVVDYGARLARHGRLADEAVLCGAALVVRYQLATGRRLTEVNVHRLLAAAVVVAVKTTSDFFYSNDHYATVAGVPAAELAVLEARLLEELQFSVWVDAGELRALAAAAVRGVAAFESTAEAALERGRHFVAAMPAVVDAPAAFATPAPSPVVRAPCPVPPKSEAEPELSPSTASWCADGSTASVSTVATPTAAPERFHHACHGPEVSPVSLRC